MSNQAVPQQQPEHSPEQADDYVKYGPKLEGQHRFGAVVLGGVAFASAALGHNTVAHDISNSLPVAAIVGAAPELVPELSPDPKTATVHIILQKREPAIAQSIIEPFSVIPRTEAANVVASKPARPIPDGPRKANPSRTVPQKSRDHPLPSPDSGPVSLPFNTINLSESVKTELAERTLFIPETFCTGTEILDDNANLIGYMTAKHCMQYLQSIIGSDGQYYAVLNSPDVDTGDSMGNLQKAGTTASFIYSKNTDQDMMIGVFKKGDEATVLAQVKKQYVGFDEAENIPFLSQAVLSGWPGYQPRNPNSFTRQNFDGFVIGTQTINTVSGGGTPVDENLKVVWVAIQDSPDGAKCSFGNSGGVGSVMTPQADGSTKLMPLGPLSAFMDFEGTTYSNPTDAAAVRRSAEAYFARIGHQVDLSNVSAICGFSVAQPDGTNIVNVVKNVTEIPGFIDGRIIQAQQDALDPNFNRVVMKNAVVLNRYSDGTADMVNGAVLEFVGNNTVGAILTWVGSDGKLHSMYYDDYEKIAFANGLNLANQPEVNETGPVQIAVDSNTQRLSFLAQDGSYYGEFAARVADTSVSAAATSGNKPNIAGQITVPTVRKGVVLPVPAFATAS